MYACRCGASLSSTRRAAARTAGGGSISGLPSVKSKTLSAPRSALRRAPSSNIRRIQDALVRLSVTARETIIAAEYSRVGRRGGDAGRCYSRRHAHGGAAARGRAGRRALSRRHGLVAALDPQHRRAGDALQRARARSSVVWRLAVGATRDDGAGISRSDVSRRHRHVSGRWRAPLRRLLVRRRHRGQSRAAAVAAGDPPGVDLARGFPRRRFGDRPTRSYREAGDDEKLFREICRHNLLVNMLSDPASVNDETVDIQARCVHRARFDSRKVSAGGTLLGDLAALGCRLRLLWGERDDSPFRPASLLIGEIREAAPSIDVHRIPRAGHWSAYENAPDVNRLLLEFFSS